MPLAYIANRTQRWNESQHESIVRLSNTILADFSDLSDAAKCTKDLSDTGGELYTPEGYPLTAQDVSDAIALFYSTHYRRIP